MDGAVILTFHGDPPKRLSINKPAFGRKPMLEARQSDLRKISEMELEQLRSSDLLWRKRVLESPSSAWVVVDGTKQLMLCSNNYLGLADNPHLKREAARALRAYGVGSGAVRVISGTMALHVELEEELAKFKRTEAAITFQSGFAANLGVIPCIVGEGDVAVSDELNHGSIIDGIRMSRAEKRVYRHADVGSLEEVLEGCGGFRRVLIVTDAVFSMDGDIAPLPEIAKLAKVHGAITYVDDAHGEGVLGELGRGAVSHFGLEGQVDVEMGTFSKAFGSVGGYVAGDKAFCELLYNKVRPFLLSGSHPPAVVAANLAAIRYVQKHPELIKRLWSNTAHFKKGLRELGFDIGRSQTPITPVMTGDSGLARSLAEELFREGVFVIPIVYPMVARDRARVRTIVSAAHTEEDLDFALGRFEKVGRKLKII
jgi:glycine C-acetyltransferase